ncbi:hypothetical protein ACFP65_08365 [Marinilactibacillus sp. GCM10026970]|uniref:hypothetical protein n=1 Tax=Marinilactibacillus sp. GCM10026970 TaxID=3252642 RepID=UPI003617140D
MPKVHAENALIFRENVGTVKTDYGKEIELTTSMNRSPIVQIEGRFISFDWEELIEQAQQPQQALDKKKSPTLPRQTQRNNLLEQSIA